MYIPILPANPRRTDFKLRSRIQHLDFEMYSFVAEQTTIYVGEFLVFSSLIMINLALRTYSINANTVIDEDHH